MIDDLRIEAPDISCFAIPLDMPIEQVIQDYSIAVLKTHKGNVTHAAKSLGVSQRTLQRWNKKRTFKG